MPGTPDQILFGWYSQVGWVGQDMWRVWERKGIQSFDGETWRLRPFEDLGIDGRIRFKLILKKQAGRTWTGFMWVRIGTTDRLLWKRWWTLGFNKMSDIYWPAVELLAVQNMLCCLYLVHMYSLGRLCRLWNVTSYVCTWSDTCESANILYPQQLL